ncbi:hypothetical protein BC828DRAFT_128786 [Blastocladiella britannica]|nr:hypothetical protein BC828DRAFT_128786 [Blastocladiella britannica]
MSLFRSAAPPTRGHSGSGRAMASPYPTTAATGTTRPMSLSPDPNQQKFSHVHPDVTATATVAATTRPRARSSATMRPTSLAMDTARATGIMSPPLPTPLSPPTHSALHPPPSPHNLSTPTSGTRVMYTLHADGTTLTCHACAKRMPLAKRPRSTGPCLATTLRTHEQTTQHALGAAGLYLWSMSGHQHQVPYAPPPNLARYSSMTVTPVEVLRMNPLYAYNAGTAASPPTLVCRVCNLALVVRHTSASGAAPTSRTERDWDAAYAAIAHEAQTAALRSGHGIAVMAAAMKVIRAWGRRVVTEDSNGSAGSEELVTLSNQEREWSSERAAVAATLSAPVPNAAAAGLAPSSPMDIAPPTKWAIGGMVSASTESGWPSTTPAAPIARTRQRSSSSAASLMVPWPRSTHEPPPPLSPHHYHLQQHQQKQLQHQHQQQQQQLLSPPVDAHSQATELDWRPRSCSDGATILTRPVPSQDYGFLHARPFPPPVAPSASAVPVVSAPAEQPSLDDMHVSPKRGIRIKDLLN